MRFPVSFMLIFMAMSLCAQFEDRINVFRSVPAAEAPVYADVDADGDLDRLQFRGMEELSE